jgi:signal peptidase II
MVWPDSFHWSSANKHLLRLSLISVLVLVLDQITKQIALSRLATFGKHQVWGDLVQFTLVFNEGGAFSTRLGSPLFYAIASFVVMAVVIGFLYHEAGRNKLLDLALSFVIGGALGNLIDRVRFGSVVDFIDVDFPDIHLAPGKFLFWDFPGYELIRWPVFNIADSAVNVGMVLIVAVLIFGSKKGQNADYSRSG